MAQDGAWLLSALASLPDWSLSDDGKRILKTFRFSNYHQTMAFVNAVAFLAHETNHHPDMSVHYNRCEVAFSTHDAGGVTQKDIASATAVERLIALARAG
jgi:4a-hydroxytetrahydrobiopterin dehydratase